MQLVCTYNRKACKVSSGFVIYLHGTVYTWLWNIYSKNEGKRSSMFFKRKNDLSEMQFGFSITNLQRLSWQIMVYSIISDQNLVVTRFLKSFLRVRWYKHIPILWNYVWHNLIFLTKAKLICLQIYELIENRL